MEAALAAFIFFVDMKFLSLQAECHLPGDEKKRVEGRVRPQGVRESREYREFRDSRESF